MKHILDLTKLKKGDIILEKGDARFRERIQSNYSHAILCVANDSCIESDGYGVNSYNPQRRLYENEDDVIVLRLNSEINNREAIIENATRKSRSLVGTKYGASELRKVRDENPTDAHSNRQFCSRLVTQSYAYGGLKIVNNIDFPELDDIAKSTSLTTIEKPLRLATLEDIEFSCTPSIFDLQNSSTSELLFKARELSGEDIQTFEQIAEYLIKSQNENFDNDFSKIFEKSPYYTLWKIEQANHPERYDYEEFKEYYRSVKEIKIGVLALIHFAHNNSRFETNYQQYTYLFKQYGYKYFELEMLLYEKLVEQLNIMREIANKAIEEFNLQF